MGLRVIEHHFTASEAELKTFLSKLERRGYHIFKKGNLQATRTFPDCEKRAHVLIKQEQGGYNASVHIDDITNNLHKVVVDEKLLKKVSMDIFG